MSELAARVAALDWAVLAAELGEHGATSTPLLTPDECAGLAALYGDRTRFRSEIDMGRHGYGRGQYRYFAYPLPDAVGELRAAFYAKLAPVATDWAARLGVAADWPPTLAELTTRCHAAGQPRPTPLMLRYGPGDYNRLHQDLYGPLVFPLQVVLLLSAPGGDFDGGEFVVMQSRPRMQSRAEVLALGQGDAAIFAVRDHPVASPRGWSRAALRHGVSRVRRGDRLTLGLIFHDAA